MKNFLRISSLLLIVSSTAVSFVPNNQNIKLENKINTTVFSQNLEHQEIILDEFSKDGIVKGRIATESEINKFSNLVPYYNFFTKLEYDWNMGYVEGPNRQGLCEYVSLSMLLLYDELFISSGYFTDAEFDSYFINPNVANNKIAMPEHKYYFKKSAEKSLSYKLWEKNGYATDIKTGSTLNRGFRSWLIKKDINEKIKSDYSVSWMHSSSPEDLLLKYNIPILISFTVTGGHNVLIYGYDKFTNSYLVNYGWRGYPKVIVKKSDIWSFWSMGFWNAFYHNSNINPVKKHFKYNGEFYTWKELEAKGLSFNDIQN